MPTTGERAAGGWEVSFDRYDPADETRRESLFSLANGVLLVRGTAPYARDRGHHYAGTYRAGLYNRLDDEVEGERVSGHALVNLPDWLALTFRIAGDDEWFDMDGVAMLSYDHRLDMRRGLMFRRMLVRDRAGRETFLDEERLVSMALPQVAAFTLRIEPRNWSGEIAVRTSLDGGVVNGNVPLYGAQENRHLVSVAAGEEGPDALLAAARTSQSGVRLAVAVRTRIAGGPVAVRRLEREDDLIAEERDCRIAPGGALLVEKTAVVCVSPEGHASDPSQEAQVLLEQAPGFAELRQRHAEAWDGLWRTCGFGAHDPHLARTIRFHLFHVLQTVCPLRGDVDAGFPGRGWQEGYHGHVFWDETFAFSFLSLSFPQAARALLLYRYRRLDAARAGAARRSAAGAMFPWRSATTGEEETPAFQKNPLSGRWMPDHTNLQVHINASIAYGLWRYACASGDGAFMRECGAEMMIEIARFLAGIARLDAPSGRYHITGVVGPDEFHVRYPGAQAPGIDDNAYTNVMAVWTLARAREVWNELDAEHRLHLAEKLGFDPNDMARWEDIERRMFVPFHGDGLISQFAGFGDLADHGLDALDGQRADWAFEARGDDVNRHQILKQADVLMLYHLLGEEELIAVLHGLGYAVTKTQLLRTAHYYLERTSHDSSLSRVATAGALARLDPQTSWAHFTRGLHRELDPLGKAGSYEGVQLGAMAGTIDVLGRQYVGVSVDVEAIAVDPAIPAELPALHFTIRCRFGVFVFRWDGRSLGITADLANEREAPLRVRGASRRLAAGETATIDVWEDGGAASGGSGNRPGRVQP